MAGIIRLKVKIGINNRLILTADADADAATAQAIKLGGAYTVGYIFMFCLVVKSTKSEPIFMPPMLFQSYKVQVFFHLDFTFSLLTRNVGKST